MPSSPPSAGLAGKSRDRLRLPSRHVTITAAALVVFGSALIIAPLFDWQPATWERVGMLWRERSLAVALPLLLVSAWQGQQLRSGLLPLGAPSQRPRSEMLVTLATRLLAVAGLALVPALAASLVVTAAGGAPGSVPALSLTASLVAIATAIPLGLVLGSASPRWGWPVIALVAGIFIWYLPLVITDTLLLNAGLSTRAVALTWGMEVPEPGLAEPAGIAVIRIGYFALLGLAALVAASSAGTPVSPIRKVAVGVGAALVPAVVVAGIGAVSERLPLVVASGAPTACEALASGETEVCVFDAHRELLPTITAIAEPLSHVAGAYMPRLVTERSSWAERGPQVTLSARLPATEEQYREAVALELTDPLVASLDECLRQGTGGDDGEAQWLLSLGAIQDRLVAASGVTPRASSVTDDGGPVVEVYSEQFLRLSAIDDEAFGAWYRVHHEQIMACEIATADLP